MPKRGGGRGRKKVAAIPPIVEVRERCLEGGWAYYLIRRDGEEDPQWSKDPREEDQQAIRQFEEKQAEQVAQIQLEHSKRIRAINDAAGVSSGDAAMAPATAASSAAASFSAAASSSAASAVPVSSASARPAVTPLSLPVEEHKSSHRLLSAVDLQSLQTLRPFRLRDEHKEQIRPASQLQQQQPDLSDGEVGDLDEESPLAMTADETFMTASIVVHDPRTLEPHYLPAASAAAAAAATRMAATAAIDLSPDSAMDDLPPLEAASAPSLLSPPILLSQPVLAAATVAAAVAASSSAAADTAAATSSSSAAASSAAGPIVAVSPVAAAVPSDPSACSICCAADPPGWAVSPLSADRARTLLSCYTCGVTVHAACYGVSVLPLPNSFWWCCVCDPSGLQRHEVPDGLGEKENTGREVERLKAQRAGKTAYDEWCEAVNLHQKSCFDAREVKCAICTQRGGAMLPLLQEFNFIHVLCARFLPPSKLEGWPTAPYRWIAVSSAFNCNDVRSAHNPLVRCEACKLERWSYCTHCAVSDCPRRFHVTCARTKGWVLESELLQSGATERQWAFKAFCREHSGLPPEQEERQQRAVAAEMIEEDDDDAPLVNLVPVKRRKQKRRRRPSLSDDERSPMKSAATAPAAADSATEDEDDAVADEEDDDASDDAADESSSSDFELTPSQTMRKQRRAKPPKTRENKRAKTERPAAASATQAAQSTPNDSPATAIEIDDDEPAHVNAAAAAPSKAQARNQLFDAFCRPRGINDGNFPASHLFAIPETIRGKPSSPALLQAIREAREERTKAFHDWCQQAILDEIKLAERAKPKHELLLKQMRSAQTLQQRFDIVHAVFGNPDELPIFLRLLQLPSPIPDADPPTGFELLMKWVGEDPFFKEISNTTQAAAAAAASSPNAAPVGEAALYESMVLELFIGLDRRFAFWSSRKLSKLSPEQLRVNAQLSQSLLYGVDPETFPEVLRKLRERDAVLRLIIQRFAFHSNEKLAAIAKKLADRMKKSAKAATGAAAAAGASAASSAVAPTLSATDLREQERRSEARAARKAEKRRMKAAAKAVSKQSWDHLTQHASSSSNGKDGHRIKSPQKPKAIAPPTAGAAAASSSSARPAAPTPVPMTAPKRRHAEAPIAKSLALVSAAAKPASSSALPVNALALAFPQDFSYPVSQAGVASYPVLSRAQEVGLASRPPPSAPASIRPSGTASQPSSLGAVPIRRSDGMGNQPAPGFFTQPLPSMPRRPAPPPATFGSAAIIAPHQHAATAAGTATHSRPALAGGSAHDDMPTLE